MKQRSTVAIIIGFSLVVVGCGGGSDTPSRVDRSGGAGAVWQKLSASDSRKTKAIVSRDPLVRRVLGDHNHAIKSIGSWERRLWLKIHKRLPFLVPVELALEPPVRKLSARWAFFGSRDYRFCKRMWLPFRVYDLKSVAVYVDLPRQSVAAIIPGQSGRQTDWKVSDLPPECRS